jgi:hypothetical protein
MAAQHKRAVGAVDSAGPQALLPSERFGDRFEAASQWLIWSREAKRAFNAHLLHTQTTKIAVQMVLFPKK